jgi:hypothetical protein
VPLYRLINGQFRAIQVRQSVKPEATIVDLLFCQRRPQPRYQAGEACNAHFSLSTRQTTFLLTYHGILSKVPPNPYELMMHANSSCS